MGRLVGQIRTDGRIDIHTHTYTHTYPISLYISIYLTFSLSLFIYMCIYMHSPPKSPKRPQMPALARGPPFRPAWMRAFWVEEREEDCWRAACGW